VGYSYLITKYKVAKAEVNQYKWEDRGAKIKYVQTREFMEFHYDKALMEPWSWSHSFYNILHIFHINEKEKAAV
jgi:hypothetical protein